MEPGDGELLAAAGASRCRSSSRPARRSRSSRSPRSLEAHLGPRRRPSTPTRRRRRSTASSLHNANGESCGGTLANAFAVSCNSVFAPLGVAPRRESRLAAAAQAYGFNAPSPIAIAAESTIPPDSRDRRRPRGRRQRDRPGAGARVAAADASRRRDDRARRAPADADLRASSRRRRFPRVDPGRRRAHDPRADASTSSLRHGDRRTDPGRRRRREDRHAGSDGVSGRATPERNRPARHAGSDRAAHSGARAAASAAARRSTTTPTTPTPGSSPSHPRSVRGSSSPCCCPTTAPAARPRRRSRRRSSRRRSASVRCAAPPRAGRLASPGPAPRGDRRPLLAAGGEARRDRGRSRHDHHADDTVAGQAARRAHGLHAALGAERVLTRTPISRASATPSSSRRWDDYTASAVLMPETVEEIQEIVRIAGRHGVPLWTHSHGPQQRLRRPGAARQAAR